MAQVQPLNILEAISRLEAQGVPPEKMLASLSSLMGWKPEKLVKYLDTNLRGIQAAMKGEGLSGAGVAAVSAGAKAPKPKGFGSYLKGLAAKYPGPATAVTALGGAMVGEQAVGAVTDLVSQLAARSGQRQAGMEMAQLGPETQYYQAMLENQRNENQVTKEALMQLLGGGGGPDVASGEMML